MSSFLCEILFTCVLAAPAAGAIDELSYRSALYQYYQQDYEQALLEVMVAERRGRTGDRPLRFELAKGSFAFQQGMYRLATSIFDQVSQAELTEQDRLRLAFHLSREYYRRGDWASLQAALARIELGTDWRGRQRRHPEVTFMRAEAAVAGGDFTAAETSLRALPRRHTYLAYGLFNLGVAYRAAGETEAARVTFRRLADLTPDGAEARDLVQRGRLALAAMARHNGATVDARALLGALPGRGRYRDLALSSYGNLAMVQQEHELAARIWLTLLDEPGWSTGHANAYLGLPMSLEALASTAHALDRYREAEQAYQRRLAALQDVARRARDPVWVDGLLAAFAQSDAQVRARELAGLDDTLGSATWLEWLSAEDVHQVMVEWRELTAIASWLERLPRRIAAYEQITGERRRRAAEARVLLDRQALTNRRLALAERVAALDADLAMLRGAAARPTSAWMGRLAHDDERQLIERLDEMSGIAAEHLPAADRPHVQARLARLRGTVFWTIADSRATRIQALAGRLADSRALLTQVDSRIARLSHAEQQFASGVEHDFRSLTRRAGDVSERVVGALEGRRRIIAGALDRGLHQEMARTRQYLLTARMAIARATDQLAVTAAAAPEGDS